MDEVHIEAMRIIVNRGNPARDAAMATVHPDMRSDVYAYITGYVIGADNLVEGYEQIKAEGIATTQYSWPGSHAASVTAWCRHDRTRRTTHRPPRWADGGRHWILERLGRLSDTDRDFRRPYHRQDRPHRDKSIPGAGQLDRSLPGSSHATAKRTILPRKPAASPKDKKALKADIVALKALHIDVDIRTTETQAEGIERILKTFA